MTTAQTEPAIDQKGPVPAFEHAARQALSNLRRSLADLIAALPEDMRRAADFQRALRLDNKTGLAAAQDRIVHGGPAEHRQPRPGSWVDRPGKDRGGATQGPEGHSRIARACVR